MATTTDTKFDSNFTYVPTDDQIKCFEHIKHDMTSLTRPMDRLICGDVGFGKTEVAIRAIYRAVQAGRQVAVLAPTRVLALQHLRVLSLRMPEVNIKLLRGGGRSDSKIVKSEITDGTCEVVVGTHALLQSTVQFSNLGLLVIDEEQRFGVGHKEKLKAATNGVDVLTLSATPIPRTLQLSLTGLRDISVMTSAPKGRKEVKVHVDINNDNGSGTNSDYSINEVMVIEALENEIKRNGQIFVVVPFVRDVVPMRKYLEELLPTLEGRIMEAHGRHDDLEHRIDSFAHLNYDSDSSDSSSGIPNYDVLIATTVIENGIDMPNVNTIIIFRADHFGMSALYQLRGRVGRSTRQAHAYFIT